MIGQVLYLEAEAAGIRATGIGCFFDDEMHALLGLRGQAKTRILRALTAVDTIEVTELARVAFLLGPSLSRILRDLEARDLIERRTAEADLRRGVVSISPKGLKLIEAVAPNSEAIYAEITHRYGARKLAELQDMLGELERSLAAMEVAGEGDAGPGE